MKTKTLGLFSIFCVYTIWGAQPIYWKLFQQVPLDQILAHRIIWSAFLLIGIIFYQNKLEELIDIFRCKKYLYLIIPSAFLIASNWLINIYAAHSNQIIEASLGHYITPIVIIFLGVFVLKEKIARYELIAALLATIGVLLLTVTIGKLPLIALLLIFTFAIYTYLKKIIKVNALLSLTVEIIVLLPFALSYLVSLELNNKGIFLQSSPKLMLLIISTGLFTAIPLLLYSFGVQRINLSKLGFIQYFGPTLSLVLGIFLFKETFTKIHLISFSFIWLSIIIVIFYSYISKNLRASPKQLKK